MLRVVITLLLISGCSFFAQSQEGTSDEYEYIVVYPNPEDDWLFGFHGAVSDSVHGTAEWFDSFFATDEIDESTSHSLARIRLGWEPRARDFAVFTQKFRVRVKLPNLADKVDLIFSDEDDDDKQNDQVQQGRALTDDNDESFTAAIRLINVDKISKFIDTRVGISGGDIFTKARLKWVSDFSRVHEFEIQPSIFYYAQDGFGQRIFTEYDYNFADRKQFRINYSVKYSEAFDGHRWKNGYYYLHQIDRRRANVVAIVAEGENGADRGFVVDNYTLSFRYRVNAYRKWLYFEIEPFIEWPEEQDYSTTPGIALRVEGYFTKD